MIRKILAGLVFVLIALQLVRTGRDLPPEDPSQTIYAGLTVPDDIRSTLETSCADCHSHRVEWPWYSQVAPVSWWIVRDVQGGLRSFNMSTWATQSDYRAAKKLESMHSEVTDSRMPLPRYLRLHPRARLSPAQRDRLADWARSESERIVASLPGGEE